MNTVTYKVLNIRVPADLVAELQVLARADARSLTNLITVVLRKYVEEHK